ncbi:hypothetical protein OU994_18340 [Pseudoduganella sp. SL102]|uniref:hypothetical protein n=1 Tax=Pseudoduganella sp. SL102 TaxID=2995154 RepID=UPI00248ABE0B|nr:hypothetical protein [Pseudoduganella sp. SL102]WBS00278.1 hypothetical protein OU994_18340 [Pseudoduganella sp. SL102]
MASPGKKAFPLRIDPALWAELQRLAANDLRSVNAEIEFLLREALARRGIRVQPPARGADDADDGGGGGDQP